VSGAERPSRTCRINLNVSDCCGGTGTAKKARSREFLAMRFSGGWFSAAGRRVRAGLPGAAGARRVASDRGGDRGGQRGGKAKHDALAAAARQRVFVGPLDLIKQARALPASWRKAVQHELSKEYFIKLAYVLQSVCAVAVCVRGTHAEYVAQSSILCTAHSP
jgi:hypothetical protein